MNNETHFLTPSQIGSAMGIHANTIRLWIRQGKIAHLRFGKKKILVERSEFERFIASGKQ